MYGCVCVNICEAIGNLYGINLIHWVYYRLHICIIIAIAFTSFIVRN